MSQDKCDCFWCQKGVSKDEAKVRRINFFTRVFELMFINLFKDFEKDVEKTTTQFKDIITKFLTDKELTGEDIDKAVIDIIFYEIGLGTDLKPSEIYIRCYKMHAAIDNAFTAFRHDIRMKETPILSGLLTPELFVINETGEGKLPENIIQLYKKASNNSITEMLENITPVIEEMLQGSENQHTVH